MLFFKKNLFIKHLTNQTIKSYLIDTEGMGLEFNNGTKFSIYNKYIIFSSKEPDYKDLIGAKIVKVQQTKELFRLSFNNTITIEVGLKDEDYNGPEALGMYLANGLIVIE